MNEIKLPQKPLTFWQLVQNAVGHQWPIFKAIFWPILFLVVVKDAHDYLGGMPQTDWLYYTVFTVMTLLMIYFWAVSLCITDDVMRFRLSKSGKNYRQALQRIWQVYLGLIVLAAYGIIFFFISRYLTHFFISLGGSKVVWTLLGFYILFATPVFTVVVMVIYAFPMMLIEGANLFPALRASVHLVGLKQWLRAFVVYAGVAIIYLLMSPYTIHHHVLTRFHITALFDLVVLSFLLPLFNAIYILSFNDLRNRQKS